MSTLTRDEGLRLLVRGRLRAAARAAWEHALERTDPEAAVLSALAIEGPRLRVADLEVEDVQRVVVFGWGKAGLPMLRAALAVLGDRVREGLVVVKDEHAEGITRLGPVRIGEARHPVPDSRSPKLAAEMLDLARSCQPGDLALVLGSGGGSSLLASPAASLALEDVQRTISGLLRSGADIHETNTVRKHLSSIHGGWLAAALGRTRSVTLLVSDVIGDDPSSIASGPTAADPTTYAEALEILQRRLPKAPPAILHHLEQGAAGQVAETPKPGTLDPQQHRQIVIASTVVAIEAAGDALKSAGFAVIVAGGALAGDPGDIARAHVAQVLDLSSQTRRPVAIVGGGEPTLEVTGDGRGGRNQHLAALAAQQLDLLARTGALDDREIVLASIATDGTDGPTDAAGGLVDGGTWARARRAGFDPGASLLAFDTYPLLEAASDLVITGPTRTNVMDLHLCLAEVLPAAKRA